MDFNTLTDREKALIAYEALQKARYQDQVNVNADRRRRHTQLDHLLLVLFFLSALAFGIFYLLGGQSFRIEPGHIKYFNYVCYAMISSFSSAGFGMIIKSAVIAWKRLTPKEKVDRSQQKIDRLKAKAKALLAKADGTKK